MRISFIITRTNMKHTKKRLGVSLIEYGVIATLIAIVAIIAIHTLSSNVNLQLCTVSHGLNNNFAMTSSGCKNTGGYGKDATYRITSTGGGGCYGPKQPENCTLMDAQVLYQFNQIDPVTSIYGLKNNGIIASTYNAAMNTLNMGTIRSYGVTDSNSGQAYQYEIEGKSGNYYGVYYTAANMGVRNLVTGETYNLNPSGVLEDVGVTNNSGG